MRISSKYVVHCNRRLSWLRTYKCCINTTFLFLGILTPKWIFPSKTRNKLIYDPSNFSIVCESENNAFFWNPFGNRAKSRLTLSHPKTTFGGCNTSQNHIRRLQNNNPDYFVSAKTGKNKQPINIKRVTQTRVVKGLLIWNFSTKVDCQLVRQQPLHHGFALGHVLCPVYRFLLPRGPGTRQLLDAWTESVESCEDFLRVGPLIKTTYCTRRREESPLAVRSSDLTAVT